MAFTALLMLTFAAICLFFAFIGDSKAAKRIKTAVAILLAVIFIAALATEIFVFAHAHTNAESDVEWIIILGAGLHGERLSYSIKSRLDRALEYLEKNQKCRIVVSGGMGAGETVTEAYAMKKYLVENGIDAQRILTEEKATTTEENLEFSFDIISSHPEYRKSDRVAVLSSAYHLFRTSIMASDLSGGRFGRITYISARTRRFIVVNYYLREIAAIWYYIILK